MVWIHELFVAKFIEKSKVTSWQRKEILTSDYLMRFWPSCFTRASVLIVVAFGLCHTLRLITNFIEMFCERLSLPRVSKPRTSEDMDGTLQDLQGPNFFFKFTRSGDFSCSNTGIFWQSTDFELWSRIYFIGTKTWATLSVPSISKEILE